MAAPTNNHIDNRFPDRRTVVGESPVGNSVYNTFEVGTLKFTALGDRVLIQEDEFRSGYECSVCKGKGDVACSECGGIGYHQRQEVHGEEGTKIKCSHCDGGGTVVCSACGGKGALLVAPETAQRRPTSGKVVSAGGECKNLGVGDSVMYSNMSGYVVDLDREGSRVVLRILHETEVLCKLEGHLELKSMRGKTEVPTYTP